MPMPSKSAHRLATINRRLKSAKPIARCAACDRPRSDDSPSGLCHRCCRQPHDPSPDEIQAEAERCRMRSLLDLVVSGD